MFLLALMRRRILLGWLCITVILSSCALSTLENTVPDNIAYVSRADKDAFSRYAPAFIVENGDKLYNRIGTVEARMDDDIEQVFVNPKRATLYQEVRSFATPNGKYTNLIYRIHFEKIPGGLPVYLGAGRNVGSLVVITLDAESGRPLLYTLVNTCGCYLGFVPTAYLAKRFWPDGWSEKQQDIYGEVWPGLLGFPQDDKRIAIVFRSETHRVKDIVYMQKSVLETLPRQTISVRPLASLEHLELEGDTTSFYEEDGPRYGYVKGSTKFWERALMSWWALDWRVGEDKKYGRNRDDGITFYTSLKPWAREASDMRDFPAFLHYWGWGL